MCVTVDRRENILSTANIVRSTYNDFTVKHCCGIVETVTQIEGGEAKSVWRRLHVSFKMCGVTGGVQWVEGVCVQ